MKPSHNESPSLTPTETREDNIDKDVDPLCNVTPNLNCDVNNKELLPLPFGRPLSAQLRCHQNTCKPLPTLVSTTICIILLKCIHIKT